MRSSPLPLCLVLLAHAAGLAPGQVTSSFRDLAVTELEVAARPQRGNAPGLAVSVRLILHGFVGEQGEVVLRFRDRQGGAIAATPSTPPEFRAKDGAVAIVRRGQVAQADQRLVEHVPYTWLSCGAQVEGIVATLRVEVDGARARGEVQLLTSPAATMRRVEVQSIEHLRREVVRTGLNPSGAGGDAIRIVDSFEDVLTRVEVEGLVDAPLYVGAFLRDAQQQLVPASVRAPRGNQGNGGRLQVQKQIDLPAAARPQERVGVTLELPLAWSQLDAGKDHLLYASVYASCEGLWAVRTRQVHVTEQRQADDAPLAGVTFAGDPANDVRQRIRSGIVTPTEALHDPVAVASPQILDLLLRSGADVRAINARGETPLHLAAARGDATAVAKLLAADQRRSNATERPLRMSFDDYLEDTFPTLGAKDADGRTPLHRAAAAGHAAAARALVGSGADPKAQDDGGSTPAELAAAAGHEGLAAALAGGESFDLGARATGVPASGEELDLDRLLYEGLYRAPPAGDPSRVSRHVAPMRKLVEAIEAATRKLEAMPQTPEPSHAKLKPLAEGLLQAGMAFAEYVGKEMLGPNSGRAGTLAEIQLIEQAAGSFGRGGERALKLSGITDLHGTSSSSGALVPSARELLEGAAEELATRAAIRWAEEHGLGEYLVVGHENFLTGKVQKHLDLNLKSIADRQCRRLLEMPLGGLRSFQSTFRYQARRALRNWVRDAVLEVTSSHLVLRIIDREVVRWVEEELWPKIREALRPKGHLDKRVQISVDTMLDSRDELNELVTRVDSYSRHEVAAVVRRAFGRLHAARYLERDLNRSGNQELLDTFEAARRVLERDLRRAQVQHVLWDEETTEGIVDLFDKLSADGSGLQKLIARLRIEPAAASVLRVEHPTPQGLDPYVSRKIWAFPTFTVRITPPPGVTPRTVFAEMNGARYTMIAEQRRGEWRACAILPVLAGPCRIVFTCAEVPAAAPFVYEATRGALLNERGREVLARKRADYQEALARLQGQQDPRQRRNQLVRVASAARDLARSLVGSGLPADAAGVARDTLRVIGQTELGTERARLHELLVPAAYAAGDAAGVKRAAEAYVAAMEEVIRDPRSPSRPQRDLATTAIKLSSFLLTVGDEASARRFLAIGRQWAREASRDPEGTIRHAIDRWPNLRAAVAGW